MRRIKKIKDLTLNQPKTIPYIIFDKLFATNTKNNIDKKFNSNYDILNNYVSSIEGLLRENTQVDMDIITVDDFLNTSTIIDHVNQYNRKVLSDLLLHYNSDKSNTHDYHFVYQPIIDSELLNKEIVSVCEIGLGTNYLDIDSNMSWSGSPGASVRAFRDYNSNLNIYGGDVDKRILFQEDRIQTTFVDQNHPKSIRLFLDKSQPDIVIDDGLHQPFSNTNVLYESLKYFSETKKEGWIIIEDISPDWSNYWKALLSVVKKSYDVAIIKTKSALMLIVRI